MYKYEEETKHMIGLNPVRYSRRGFHTDACSFLLSYHRGWICASCNVHWASRTVLTMKGDQGKLNEKE